MIYSTPKLDNRDREVIDEVEDLRNQLHHRINPSKRWTGSLRRLTLARVIQSSTNIEGYTVSEDDAQAAVLQDDKPIAANNEDWLAVTGYRQAMSYILQIADDPHATCGLDLIRSLHFMLIGHEPGKEPGRWRSAANAIRDARGNVVYEPPNAEEVPALMEEFMRWLNTRDRQTPALVRGAMSHLNLVLIHPFRDGNGRMARCLQSLVLTREGILGPEFCSIEEFLGGDNTPLYYKALAEVSKGHWEPHGQTGSFVRFCLGLHYRQAHQLLIRTRMFEQLWDDLERAIEQRSLPARTVFALSDATFGHRVRNSTYRRQAEISENTASHDLKLLTDQKLLIAQGDRRGRCYKASLSLMKIAKPAHDQAFKPVPDPYSLSASAQRPPFGR